MGLFNLLSAFAIAALGGGRSAIIAFTMPVWTVLIEVALGRRLARLQAVSVGFGIAGVGLILFSVVTDPTFEPLAALLMAIAALSWAMGIVWTSRKRFSLDAQALAAWMMLISLGVVLLAVPFQDEPLLSLPSTAASLMGLFYATLIGMAACQTLWFSLLERITSINASLILLGIPAAGAAMSWAFAGAAVTVLDSAALAMLLGSALMAIFCKPSD